MQKQLLKHSIFWLSTWHTWEEWTSIGGLPLSVLYVGKCLRHSLYYWFMWEGQRLEAVTSVEGGSGLYKNGSLASQGQQVGKQLSFLASASVPALRFLSWASSMNSLASELILRWERVFRSLHSGRALRSCLLSAAYIGSFSMKTVHGFFSSFYFCLILRHIRYKITSSYC